MRIFWFPHEVHSDGKLISIGMSLGWSYFVRVKDLCFSKTYKGAQRFAHHFSELFTVGLRLHLVCYFSTLGWNCLSLGTWSVWEWLEVLLGGSSLSWSFLPGSYHKSSMSLIPPFFVCLFFWDRVFSYSASLFKVPNLLPQPPELGLRVHTSMPDSGTTF
jgi:hypothetical protein